MDQMRFPPMVLESDLEGRLRRSLLFGQLREWVPRKAFWSRPLATGTGAPGPRGERKGAFPSFGHCAGFTSFIATYSYSLFSSRICLGSHVSPPDAVSLTLGRYRGPVPAPLGPASTRSGLRSALRRPALVDTPAVSPGGDEEADPDGGPPKRRGLANTSWRTSGGKHSGSVGP